MAWDGVWVPPAASPGPPRRGRGPCHAADPRPARSRRVSTEPAGPARSSGDVFYSPLRSRRPAAAPPGAAGKPPHARRRTPLPPGSMAPGRCRSIRGAEGDEDDTAGLFGGTDGQVQTRPGHDDPADRLRPAPPALDRRLLATGTGRWRRRGGE